MDEATRRGLLDEFKNTPRVPPLGGLALVNAADVRRRYNVCLNEAHDQRSPCRMEEIPDSSKKMLAVRAILGDLCGPLHRCDACGCLLEARLITGAHCPRGKW